MRQNASREPDTLRMVDVALDCEPSASTPETPIIGLATDATLDAALAFHRANLGEFILPLASTTFREIIEERQMITVERDGTITGLCYVKPDGKELDEVPRWEFGGLYLAPAARGLGLGTLLSKVAIAAVTHANRKPVMGYVHQENHEGLGLLIHRLGFTVTDQTVRLGPNHAPGYLRRDSAGFATANVLHLSRAGLARIADDLEYLCDGLSDHHTRISFRFAEGLFPSSLAEVAKQLRA